MILYLTHGNGEESIPLKLPASSSQVEEIDIRLDDICSGEGNFRISDVKSSVKGLWQFIRSADLLAPEDLEKLNRLSRQIDAMSEKEHQIFAGALLSECISNLDDVLQTVGRIGQYGMIPKVTCDRELGGYLVEHGKIDCPEHLKPYLDYVGIGAEFYSNCGGAYTLDGENDKRHVVIYARVSTRNQKDDLLNQVAFLRQFCNAKGIIVDQCIEDYGSGLNYNRKKWNELLDEVMKRKIKTILVTHKDRFISVGYEWFEKFCMKFNTTIVIVNNEELSPQEELVQDIVSILHVFSCRLYGLRKYKKQIEGDEEIAKELQDGNKSDRGAENQDS